MRWEIKEYKRKLKDNTILVNKEAELRIAKVRQECNEEK